MQSGRYAWRDPPRHLDGGLLGVTARQVL